MMTVVAVLALAVVGTGAAFAYRTYVGSPRSGEPPIIKADNSPTKIVPAPADGARQDAGPHGARRWRRKARFARGNAGRRQRAKSGPRVVFPPLNQNGNPPSVASVSPDRRRRRRRPRNGTMPNNEPRKIKTLPVRAIAAENGGVPAGAPPPAQTGASCRNGGAAPAASRAGRAQPAVRPMPAPTRRCR